MADKYYGWSPFVYSLDNSIANIDVDGRFVVKEGMFISVSRSEFFSEFTGWKILGWSKDNLFPNQVGENVAGNLLSKIISGISKQAERLYNYYEKVETVWDANDRETEWHAEQELFDQIKNDYIKYNNKIIPVFQIDVLNSLDRKYNPEKYPHSGKILVVNPNYLAKMRELTGENNEIILSNLESYYKGLRYTRYLSKKSIQQHYDDVYGADKNEINYSFFEFYFSLWMLAIPG